MTNDPNKQPPFDWKGQLRYFAIMLVGIVAGLMLLRVLGLRG